jgi:hypothetical protein
LASGLQSLTCNATPRSCRTKKEKQNGKSKDSEEGQEARNREAVVAPGSVVLSYSLVKKGRARKGSGPFFVPAQIFASVENLNTSLQISTSLPRIASPASHPQDTDPLFLHEIANVFLSAGFGQRIAITST